MSKWMDLSEHDRDEIAKFADWLKLEESRRSGGDPAVLNMLEQALYHEGIGRDPIDGEPEA